MADANEQITAEQAQKIYEDSFKGTTPTAVVDPPALETPPEKVEPTPAVEPAKEVPSTEVVKDEPAKAEPAKPEKVEENKEPAKEEPAKPTDTDPYAWVKEIPEAQRAKVLKEIEDKFAFKHQFESNKGRIASFQQKLLEAQKQISERPTAKPATSQPTKTPEGWDELAKADPEIAKAVEARVTSEVEKATEALRAEMQELKKTGIDPLYEHQTTQYVERERDALKAAVPNYEQVVTSPQYREWLSTIAPPKVREVALKSNSHQDAIEVLKFYANDMVRLGYAKAPEAASEPVQPTPPAKADTTEADRVAAERAKKLEAPAPVVATAFTPSGTGQPTQFTREQAEAEYQRIAKELYKKT